MIRSNRRNKGTDPPSKLKTMVNTMVRSIWRLIFFNVIAWTVSSYPMYIQFRYLPSVEYDITSNASFLHVRSAYDTPLHFYLPPECDGSVIHARKVPPYVVLELSCDDEQILVRDMTM